MKDSLRSNRIKSEITIRIGKFEEDFVDSVMEPIVGMDEPWHYRNKAQFPVGCDKNGKLITVLCRTDT